MITAEQLAWTVKHLCPSLPAHGHSWLVAMELDSDGTQERDATIVVWKLYDIPQPTQDELLSHWAKPDVQAAYEESLKPPPQTQFSVRDFAKRFTLAEQIAIRQASMTDMEVGLVYDDFNRAQYIDVTDPDTAAGLDLYITKGLLSPERKAELLATA